MRTCFADGAIKIGDESGVPRALGVAVGVVGVGSRGTAGCRVALHDHVSEQSQQVEAQGA